MGVLPFPGNYIWSIYLSAAPDGTRRSCRIDADLLTPSQIKIVASVGKSQRGGVEDVCLA
jgi:hypothetical protein